MKRKAARVEKADKEERNGVELQSDIEEDIDAIHDAIDSDSEQVSGKRKKGQKKKTAGRKSVKNDSTSDNEDDLNADDAKKKHHRKSGKRASKRGQSDSEFEKEEGSLDENEESDKKRKSSKRTEDSKKKTGDKRKSGKKTKKEETSEVEENLEQEAEPEPKKKKADKKNAPKEEEEVEPEVDGEEEDTDVEYEVEEVLNERKLKGVHQYLIRWKGYDSDGDTWENESTLNCPELIKIFEDSKNDKDESPVTKKKPKKEKKKKGTVENKVDWSSDDEFEVDRILEVHFKRNGKREFLVSWKGYPSSQDSWEPEDNLECTDLITRFMDKVATARNADAKDLRIKRAQTERFTLQMGGGSRRLSRRLGTKQRVQYHDAE